MTKADKNFFVNVHLLLLRHLEGAQERVTRRHELVPLAPTAKISLDAYLAELKESAEVMFAELTREEEQEHSAALFDK